MKMRHSIVIYNLTTPNTNVGKHMKNQGQSEPDGKTSKMEIHLSSTFGEERAFSVELFSVVGEWNAADLPEEGLEDVVAQIL